MIDPQIWRGRRVLLTGHTGFKGAWLALWLQELGAEVFGLALPPASQPSLCEIAGLEKRFTSVYCDLRDFTGVAEAVQRIRPHIVLHLAAQALVRASIADPVGTMATNVMGTVHLLEALKTSPGLTTVLVVTSDKVYANDESASPFREDDALGGKDPYSASKAATEIVVRAYRETYYRKADISIATARAGNVIGGGDYACDRLVPDIVRSIERGERLILRMPSASRPWQHVLDCLFGYILFAQALERKLPISASLNFGPDSHAPATVADLACAMLNAFGEAPTYEHRASNDSIEMRSLAITSDLARDSLRWSERLPGQAAIDWTANWYRRVRSGDHPLDVTLAQINAFSRLAG